MAETKAAARKEGARALGAARRAHEATQVAERREEQAWKDALPVGAEVSYEHGEHLRSGVVLMVAYGRVKIATPHGREAWLYCSRITRVRWPDPTEWTICSSCSRGIPTEEAQKCATCGADGLGNCCIGEADHVHEEVTP